MLRENLSLEELKQYEQTFALPASLDEMRRQGDIQLPLFLKPLGCSCIEKMRIFQEKSWEIFAAVYGEDIESYLVDKEKQGGNPKYEGDLRKLSRQTAKKRECHMHLRGFTCYCDEHKH